GIAMHTFHDVNNQFPRGGACGYVNAGGTYGSGWDGSYQYDWNSDQGSWIVWTLPYMEQDNLFKLINPRLNVPNSVCNGVTGWDPNSKTGWPPQPGYGMLNVPTGSRLLNKTMRCPSDDYQLDQPWSNYAGSLGPQCAIGPCGYDPHQQFCNGRTG